MSTAVIVLLFALGVVLIVKGGDAFVDAATWIAEAFHIPKFIVGATIVSLATTLPELLVSSIAALISSIVAETSVILTSALERFCTTFWEELLSCSEFPAILSIISGCAPAMHSRY